MRRMRAYAYISLALLLLAGCDTAPESERIAMCETNGFSHAECVQEPTRECVQTGKCSR